MGVGDISKWSNSHEHEKEFQEFDNWEGAKVANWLSVLSPNSWI